MHHVSATIALKEEEKEFSHAKRAEVAWYTCVRRSTRE